MLRQSAIVAAALVFAPQAFAACAQKDLKGSWRFEFVTGIVRSDLDRLETMSCILGIKNDGTIVPGKCTPVDTSGEDGEFFNPGNLKLKMIAKKCEVKFAGSSPAMGIRWDDGMNVLTRNFTGARLSISGDKQAMSGWLSNAGTATFTVNALKRAKP